jgi:hypothetical protein
VTDEEMAHEYAIENYEYYSEGHTDYVTLKQAFLAGLKAGEEMSKKNISTEDMLKELLDRKVIRSWYYNGKYHVGNELS